MATNPTSGSHLGRIHKLQRRRPGKTSSVPCLHCPDPTHGPLQASRWRKLDGGGIMRNVNNVVSSGCQMCLTAEIFPSHPHIPSPLLINYSQISCGLFPSYVSAVWSSQLGSYCQHFTLPPLLPVQIIFTKLCFCLCIFISDKLTTSHRFSPTIR